MATATWHPRHYGTVARSANRPPYVFVSGSRSLGSRETCSTNGRMTASSDRAKRRVTAMLAASGATFKRVSTAGRSRRAVRVYLSYADGDDPEFCPDVAIDRHQSAPAIMSRTWLSVRAG